MADYNTLGKLLLQAGYLANDGEVERFSKEANDGNTSFLAGVIKAKKLNPSHVANFLAQKFMMPYIDLDYFNIDFIPQEVDYKLIDKYKFKFLPLKKTANGLTIAISEPPSQIIQTLVQELQFATNIKNITQVFAEEHKLENLINKYLQIKGANFSADMENESSDLFENIESGDEEDNITIDNDVEDTPIVKFIQSVLLDAVRLKVSDIHFEPFENTYRVRFRLDGQLYEAKKNLPGNIKEKVASRIKVISKMDISEKRKPQDGRFKLPLSKDRAIDFRVSSLPTLWGEKIVMRILDSSADNLDIDRLGYDPIQKKLLMDAVARPYGMVLVTGPTGSGKTVSLYSCLNILNKEDVNICTAEDPVEINLPGINQVNINPKADLTFDSVLKSFLRQDPDTILIGEIRDLGTADIAIKAAQTGHMVLSTLHTNDAPKTITRLLNMGVAPFNIASSVILITAQRLARRLCSCKEKDDVPVDILLEAGLDPAELEGYGKKWHVYRPHGCQECNGKGYKGRVGIYQVMPITEEIRRIILRSGTDIEIAEASRASGVLGLREAGLQKVKEGITSLEEVLGTTNID
jgi:type IV pilus assembly protein PilB